LVASRGFTDADARARLAAQPSNDERRALADRVIANEGTIEELHAMIDAALEGLGVA
jgi:dephospho-CoA kinase